MMLLQPKWMLLILAILFLVVMVTGEEKKSGEKPENKLDVEKRSQEDIMFGNQQNKPAGMVDDLLAFPEGHERKPDANNVTVNKALGKTDKNENSPNALKQRGSTDDERFDYYDYVPDNSNQDNSYPLEAALNSRIPISSHLPDPQLYIPREIPDYPSEDFDNSLYRRKRTARRPLRKRSLRSNLEDLLGSHHRLPRRAPRLKRDAGVEQILNWLEMLKHQQQQQQQQEGLPEGSFGDGNDDAAQWAYYYYDFPKQQALQQQALQQEPIEIPPTLLDNLALETAAEEARNDEDWRYNMPYGPVRRSPSYFYPMDYRYILMPGQKKRAPSRHMGRWGKFMNRRRLGAEAGDDDLYALGNMLTEGDDPQGVERRRRRSA